MIYDNGINQIKQYLEQRSDFVGFTNTNVEEFDPNQRGPASAHFIDFEPEVNSVDKGYEVIGTQTLSDSAQPPNGFFYRPSKLDWEQSLIYNTSGSNPRLGAMDLTQITFDVPTDIIGMGTFNDNYYLFFALDGLTFQTIGVDNTAEDIAFKPDGSALCIIDHSIALATASKIHRYSYNSSTEQFDLDDTIDEAGDDISSYGNPVCAVWKPDGTEVAVGTLRHSGVSEIMIIRDSTWSIVDFINENDINWRELDYSRAGDFLCGTTSEAGEDTFVYNTSSYSKVATLTEPTNNFSVPRFSPTNDILCVANGLGGQVYVYNYSWTLLETITGFSGSLRDLQFSKDGSTLFVGNTDGLVFVVNTTSWEIQETINTGSTSLNAVETLNEGTNETFVAGNIQYQLQRETLGNMYFTKFPELDPDNGDIEVSAPIFFNQR